MRRSFFIALLVLLLQSGTAFAQDLGKTQQQFPASEYPVWSQAAQPWAAVRLGSKTVREIGCLVTSIAMIAAATGTHYDPLALAIDLTRNGLLTPGGAIRWSIFDRLLPNLRISTRFLVPRGSDGIQEVASQIGVRKHVLIKLSRQGRPHWVLVNKPLADDFTINDPDGGKTGSYRTLYGSRAQIKEVLVISEVG